MEIFIGTWTSIVYEVEIPTADGEIQEIVYDEVRNIENEQRLYYGWVTADYALIDKADRELLTETDSYYSWESERTKMIERIQNVSTYDITTDTHVISSQDAEDLKSQWEDIVGEYLSQIQKRGLTECWYDEVFHDGRSYSTDFESVLDDAQVEEVK